MAENEPRLDFTGRIPELDGIRANVQYLERSMKRKQ